ncbi:two-component system sensor histidine kinase DctS [Ureibacillus xyleni]|uniref:histidine kinase n=1 Tax=Ureibacillus xyleni TaxID=614648 RepID=A0A285TG37_9BACL|nr:sensor histidine kinase [Ureibacillus xyleni]SOC20927.1 two-component system sensor histidine kinase DctS [Ureibacillus xyleni]
MNKRKLSMNGKIMLLTFFIIAFSFLIAGTFVIGSVLKKQEENIGQEAMLIARTVANLPEVKSSLAHDNFKTASTKINEVVEDIRFINRADYIVIMNMERKKFSHPSKSEIGKISKSTDLDAAFAEHYYISKAKGEEGTTLRAFVPIMNEKNVQIGVALVGFTIPSFTKFILQFQNELLITIALTIVFSIWGAHTLGRHIKTQMFGLEPHEISRLYVERAETFNAMHDGIIAVDKDLNITVFNKKASEILGVTGDPTDNIGKNIYDVLPDTRLPEIFFSGKPVYDQELYVNEHSILSNRVPILVNGKKVGAVAVFKDLTAVKLLAEELTAVKLLAEELTGVKAFVQALRVQTHEYKNKLHTIAGLLHLGHTKQALEYLSQVKEEHENVTKFLNERIYNENISGLLLSKISRGKELGITVTIDKESRFTKFPEKLDHHDFVILFGNLIENAFDSLVLVDKEDKEITISIDDNDGLLAILVSDNGTGMPDEVKLKLFEKWFSTKAKENRGIGLYLVNEIVNKGNGTIEVISELNKGTTFLITFEL